ncbi:porin PorA family protein [Phytohabitans rumicis]|uniref:porin PorA family protein n=1 Tax=Phytohabitans rumicis TaxID=1076125 RepID=UPI001563AF20|nr:porin PorA family protein [Phytohabitans rumicis]
MSSSSRRVLVVGLAVLGVLCLAAAAILKWVVVPNQARVPSDESTTRQFDGTAKVLLNPQALNTGDLQSALLVNTPVAATRTVKTLATSGDTAQMQDSRTLTTTSGQTVGQTQASYAVDRKTLEATSDHPSDWQVTAAQGLTVSWPIGADKKDYTGWVQETQTTTPLKYLREETKNGLTTYVYEANAEAAPVKDPQVLQALPTALPVSTLEALSAVLPLTPELKSQLAALLPQVTQPVPLSYTYEAQTTYWVEPRTGLVVDVQRAETRKAGLSVQGRTIAAVLPVFDVAVAYTSASAGEAASDAKDKKDTLDLADTTLPLILLIVGILLILAAVVLFLLTRTARKGTLLTLFA